MSIGHTHVRRATSADATWMAELRADVMRDDLERLGRYDSERVRTRFLDAYVPRYTRVIEIDGTPVGLFALRPDGDVTWLEHFYLARHVQGRGIGHAVLQLIRDELPHRKLMLNVLQGSPARRLYERHGFVLVSEDAIDVYLSSTVTADIQK